MSGTRHPDIVPSFLHLSGVFGGRVGDLGRRKPRARKDDRNFNESPLYLRHPAIDKLPELLEALAKTGTTVAGKLTRAAARATEIAEAVSPSPKGKK